MEVAIQPAVRLAHVSPPAMDARIAQQEIGCDQAVPVTERRADLTAVCDVARVGGIHQRTILPAATGHAGSIRQGALNAARRLAPDQNP